MRLVNTSRQVVLAAKVSIADNFASRIKGLLGREGLNLDEALVIRPCNSVHTFFMRFAIDVLFVDRFNCVVEMVRDLKPFRLTKIYPAAFFVVEFPAGTLSLKKVEKGDILALD